MNPLEARIRRLEAQVNAMAQAWLYLAANIEVNTGMDMTRMEADMCQCRWPGSPEIEEEARHALRWLRAQAEEARENRRQMQQARTVEAVKYRRGVEMSNVIPMHRGRRPAM